MLVPRHAQMQRRRPPALARKRRRARRRKTTTKTKTKKKKTPTTTTPRKMDLLTRRTARRTVVEVGSPDRAARGLVRREKRTPKRRRQKW